MAGTKERAKITFAIYERARQAAGLTDYAVCKATGVKASCICDWKHGRYTPKHDKLLKISKLLQIPVSIFDEVA
jgi:transcriptional regulator with XRE-family HTH domain